MIIIVEGPDGSGKTTLARNLSKALKYGYKHFSFPKNEKEGKSLFATYFRFLQERDNVVVDRMWPSTMVYGPIMRGKSEISQCQADILELSFKKKILILYCTGSPDVLWNRCTSRGEDYVVDREQFNAICKAYDKLLLHQPHLVPVQKWSIERSIDD